MTTQEIEKYLGVVNDELDWTGSKGRFIHAAAWILSVPALRDPRFVSVVESLKAIALAEILLPFRLRKIFVLENFLSRV